MALCELSSGGCTLHRLGSRLSGMVATLGRDPSSSVAVQDAGGATISRHHAEIHRIHDTYLLVDCGSRGGTWLNGKRLPEREPAPLAEGDRLALACDPSTGEAACRLEFVRCTPPQTGQLPVPPVVAPRPRPEGPEAPVLGGQPTIQRWAEDLATCAVCQEVLVAAHGSMNCSHRFCGECIQRWVALRGTCPECRTPVGVPVPLPAMDALAEEVASALADGNSLSLREVRKKRWARVGALRKNAHKRRAQRMGQLEKGAPSSMGERQEFTAMAAQYWNQPLKVRAERRVE